MKPKARSIQLIAIVFLMIVLMAVSGCSVLKSKKGSKNSASAISAQPAQPQTVYLDFGDVLFPKELRIERNESFVFTTAGLTAGVLSLKGRVETTSLITFFENRMPEDGWKLISAIKAERSMLLFKKQTRWCVVSISAGQMYSYAQVWVAPTMASKSGVVK